MRRLPSRLPGNSMLADRTGVDRIGHVVGIDFGDRLISGDAHEWAAPATVGEITVVCASRPSRAEEKRPSSSRSNRPRETTVAVPPDTIIGNDHRESVMTVTLEPERWSSMIDSLRSMSLTRAVCSAGFACNTKKCAAAGQVNEGPVRLDQVAFINSLFLHIRLEWLVSALPPAAVGVLLSGWDVVGGMTAAATHREATRHSCNGSYSRCSGGSIPP